MIRQFSNREVDRLAERLRCDSLETSEAECLREIIRHHPSARRRLVEQLYLAADLKEAISNRTIEKVSGASRTSVRGWLPFLVGGLAAAAVFMLLVMKPWARGMEPPATVVVAESAALDAGGIAVVSQSSNVKWGAGTTLPLDRLNNGLPLGKGVIELLEGVVQVDFYSGVTAILRGPARFHLVSPELSRLDYGNLWAKVPPPARGFRVDCEAFKVVDLGTEFGIDVKSDGEGEVHVIEGEVRVQSVFEDGQPETLLRTGNGISYGRDGSSVAIEARPEKFLASAQLSKKAQGRFQQWSVFQESLRKDPDVLVAYTLPQVSSWERNVLNRAEFGPALTNGTAVGCNWVEGRWPGKGGLKFGNSSHRVILDVPGLYDDLTLACWVRIDDLGSSVVSLMHPLTSQDQYFHWSLLNVEQDVMQVYFAETSLIDGVRDRNEYPCSVNVMHFTSLGEWVHLGLVYDRKARQVSHYVNGEVMGVSPISELREMAVGIANIGNWPYEEWAAGTKWEERNIDGVVDEFLIMKRAWTPGEMRKLWSVGQP